MPKLRGPPLREFLERVATQVAVALDVNEAFDDPSLPLGPIGERPFASVSVLHCNLEEAAACLNRKEALMEKAAAVAGVPASQVTLEAWITPEDLENLADELIDAGVGIVLITLGASGAFGACCTDEATLRAQLRQAAPPDLSGIAGRRAHVPSFRARGQINSVGAGDCFLAGVVAALCHFSEGERASSLPELLRCGAASALFRVDTARTECPSVGGLLAALDELEELPLENSLLASLPR